MGKSLILIHPFLISIFPIISLYYDNMGEAPLFIILIPTAGMLGFTALLLLVTKLIFKDVLKAGVVVSVLLIIALSYNHFAALIVGSISVFTHKYLLAMIGLILICTFYLVVNIKPSSLVAFTKILNVVAVFLFLFPLANIGVYKFKTLVDLSDGRSKEKMPLAETDPNIHKKLPDIYYIVLDRYANEDTLRTIYNFDNSDFIDYLSIKGFYVASESNANYSKTAHSLPMAKFPPD